MQFVRIQQCIWKVKLFTAMDGSLLYLLEPEDKSEGIKETAGWWWRHSSSPTQFRPIRSQPTTTTYSEEFGQAIQFDPIITPADEINQGADEASKRYTFINGSLRGVLGASYGGHLANWMEATTTHYKAIISHAGLSSQVTQWATSDVIYAREMNMGGPVWENNVIWNDHSPTSRAGNHALGTGWVTPMLLTVGEHDFRVPINNTFEMFTYLQRLHVPSKLL